MNHFYRCHSQAQRRELFAKAAADGRENPEEGWVRGIAAPEDRRGLIAMFHAQCMLTEEHVGQVNKMAEAIAVRTQQRVYIVGTETRWHLLLFADEDGGYDSVVDGQYANDQFIGYYEPDGAWHLVGCS